MFNYRMVIFQSIQKYLAIIGIHQCHQSTVKHELNEHNLMAVGILGTASISSSLYLFEELNFEEYIISVYGTTVSIISTVNCATMVWKSVRIFEFIQGLEDIIQMSK